MAQSTVRATNKSRKKRALNLSDAVYTKLENEALQAGFKSIDAYLAHAHHVDAPKIKKSHDADWRVPAPSLKTKYGKIVCADSSLYLNRCINDNSVDLIMTSPPFGLVRKKAYGNEDADLYVAWFEKFAAEFSRVLKPNGSLVIDIGGAWKAGLPTKSLYHYELLLMLCKKYGFHLAQEFFWWNPARLPTPAEWVNIRRVRVKDAVNSVWWLSKTPYPKVSNKRILQPYSDSMKGLLKNGYTPKMRPSGHDISDKFQRDNGGAIPPNLIALANTESNGIYQRYCREHNLPEHPARFPAGLPAFFIRMLTDKNDVVIDPFAGSCITGAVAEHFQRKWVCCELSSEYIEGAKGRFQDDVIGLFPDIQSKRSKPYEIFPPAFVLSEEDTPLVQDGGIKRNPKK